MLAHCISFAPSRPFVFVVDQVLVHVNRVLGLLLGVDEIVVDVTRF
jgi:hypothetical protein